MSHENPGAYREAQNTLNDLKEREKKVLEERTESFEKGKEKIRRKKKLDIFELKRRIETGNSLDMLKTEMKEALDAGEISIDTYTKSLAQIEKRAQNDVPDILRDRVPLSKNQFAQMLESSPLWQNIWTDMVWFMYGFFVQGSAVLVILLWKILLDTLLLPKDIYTLIRE